MNNQDSGYASSAICFAAEQIKQAWQEAAWEQMRPSVVLKPVLSKDGSMWCALLGDDLMAGVSGFGETPAKAMYAFDQAWHSPKGYHTIPEQARTKETGK
jgi:hypothetical protein